jgi:hypothetical protein
MPHPPLLPPGGMNLPEGMQLPDGMNPPNVIPDAKTGEANVERYERIVVRATTSAGTELVFESTGFEAVCLQHELDHLDGILFLDRVTCLKTHVFRRKGLKPRLAPEEIVK